jgi:hypothetical protein
MNMLRYGSCRRLTWASLVLALALSLPGTYGRATAFDPLHAQLASGGASELFGSGEATATVQDGPLRGRGYERIERLAGGGWRVLRTQTYTQIKDRESGKLVRLPEPWHTRQLLELSPQLRLLREDFTASFHRSVDRALGREASRDDLAELFAWDRLRIRPEGAGGRLAMTTTRGNRTVQREHYAYPPEAIAFEIVAMAVSVAVSLRLSHFEFELLMPGGDSHGVAAQVHRTRDASRFARDYRVPRHALRPAAGELAVVDLWLASPFKRLFFPHHFYLVYASARPGDLLALWGGDPDEHLQAFRDSNLD